MEVDIITRLKWVCVSCIEKPSTFNRQQSRELGAQAQKLQQQKRRTLPT